MQHLVLGRVAAGREVVRAHRLGGPELQQANTDLVVRPPDAAGLLRLPDPCAGPADDAVHPQGRQQAVLPAHVLLRAALRHPARSRRPHLRAGVSADQSVPKPHTGGLERVRRQRGRQPEADVAGLRRGRRVRQAQPHPGPAPVRRRIPGDPPGDARAAAGVHPLRGPTRLPTSCTRWPTPAGYGAPT
jgi:hypothetical protein